MAGMALVGGAVYGSGMGFVVGSIFNNSKKGAVKGMVVGIIAVAMAILFGPRGFYASFVVFTVLAMVQVKNYKRILQEKPVISLKERC